MIDTARELEAARKYALLLLPDEIATLEVTGSDRLTWLNGLVTCDIGKLRPDQGAYGLSVAKNGKIQGEVWIVAAEDRVFCGVRESCMKRLREVFEHHLIMEDAEMRDATDEVAWIFAHGPRSADLADVACQNGAVGASMDMTGLGGAAIAAPIAAVATVLDALRAEGGDELVVGTCEGWDRLRLEQGIPAWGRDFSDDTYPQEASLEKLAVSFNKGCYFGQEAVCMLELRGHVKRKLMKLAVTAGEGEIPAGAEIALPDGTLVGTVTTRGPSANEGVTAALGYVKYKHAVAGTAVTVAGHAAHILP